jgi:hypothetical protein
MMTDQLIPSTPSNSPQAAHSQQMLLLGLAALLVSFGLTMFLFSAAYVKDIQTLARAPELVWAFICGEPSEFGVTLPLLLTIGTLSVLGGAGALVWRWWRGHRS